MRSFRSFAGGGAVPLTIMNYEYSSIGLCRVRCDWLQVANCNANEGCKTYASLAGLLLTFITAQCTLVQMRGLGIAHVVCLSVRL